MAVITEKHRAERKVTQTVFIPLQRAIQLDKAAKRLGVSRNRLINSCIDFGLENEDKMTIADMSSVGGRAINHTPAAEEVVNKATTT